MASDRPTVRLACAALLVGALGLCGCGRNGPLELPPAAAAAQPAYVAPPPGAGPQSAAAREQETAAKTGFDSQGNPIAAPGQKKSFFLDPLLQ